MLSPHNEPHGYTINGTTLMKRHTLKITATLLVASMGLTSLPVQAMSISTQEAIELTAAVDGRASVNAMLARAD